MRRSNAMACAFALVLAMVGLVSCKGPSYGTNPPPPPPGGELGSPTLAAGSGAYPHTFNTVGVFRYKCVIHPSCATLQGVVTVVPTAVPIQAAHDLNAITFSGGSAADPYNPAVCSMLSNTADSVHVGDTVTWTNTSPLPHTVTSY